MTSVPQDFAEPSQGIDDHAGRMEVLKRPGFGEDADR